MKVMVVGGGGREHVLAWKIAGSPLVGEVICVPGNGGMEEIGECVNADISDHRALSELAEKRAVDLTVVGPEAPLVEGIVDHFEERGLRILGPGRGAARVEGSKLFAKSVMERHGIPTGRARSFESFERARAYVESLRPPVVVKADGLAAGKGVTVAPDIGTAVKALSDCMVERAFGRSGLKVLVEEYLEGPEVSMLTLTDGEATAHMVPSQDHKRVFDGDEGPNTGGMGAYSPVPLLDGETEEYIHRDIMDATVKAMRADGIPYMGVLYGGLILTDDGPKVLEFNVRFGDPESQAVLPRLKSDLVHGMLATLDGRVAELEMEWSDEYCVCVVIASGGYPGDYTTGIPIHGIRAAAEDPRVEVFHAGTRLVEGELLTAGGRVLNVVATGADFEEARGLAYDAARRISFEGMHYRTDIGHRAIS